MSDMGRCAVHGIAYSVKVANGTREEYCPECECDTLRQQLAAAQEAAAFDRERLDIAEASEKYLAGQLAEARERAAKWQELAMCDTLKLFAPYLKDGETPIERLERERQDTNTLMGLLAAERTALEAERAAHAAANEQVKTLGVVVAELRQQLAAERQKRCGTCHWWLNDRCHCGVTCPVHLRWVPSDFGCPHWRGKEAQ